MATPASLRNIRNDASTTTPSRWRRHRSSGNMLEQFQQPATTSQKPAPTPQKPAVTPAAKPAAKLERSSSKMSLFNLFSRPKVEKARGHTEVGLAVPMRPQTPPKPAPSIPPKSALRHNPPPAVQQAARSRSSQILRPMSSMSLRPSPSIKVEKPEADHWTPPPLFQAYPQSIKYATVQACVYSPDVLLRTQSQRRQHEAMRERMDSHRDLSAIMENGAEARKLEKSHRRLVSNSIMNPSVPQLTNKVYVLVTAGYLLQYSGDGPFDRLPEKVLKLGKESAAFACDLIPGKHWVLQISQSANEDGTVAIGPKSTLLSRLRLQNSSARRTATTFLLVLESPDEMNAWMSSIRKEIDNLGGGKAKDESERDSSSIEEPSPEKQSQDNASITSHRYHVQRDPKRISKMVDSPLQSQYSESPKIVASDWEGTRSEKTISIAGSASIHSSRHSIKRNSVEVSSIATTSMSHDQLELNSLRERSRYSYVSNATSVSGTGTGTRNTSRNSSPAPTSPLKEGFSPADAEPLRSATSLRSFHMNPGNANTTRRRSMQPLPVTNEDSSLSAVSTTVTPQRHSIYGPTSPTLRTPEDVPSLTKPASPPAAVAVRDPSPSPTATPVPAPPPSPIPEAAPKSQLAPLLINLTPRIRYSTQPPLRNPARSSSAPPARYGAISPPPREPAPGPPSTRPQSTIGNLPNSATLTTPRPNTSERRLSATPKPFLRPFPVRPQAQHVQQRDSAMVVPKRMSSLGLAPMNLGMVVTPNRSVTTPVRPPSVSAVHSDPIHKNSPQREQLRRPNSVQIRSDPAPFLSNSRFSTGAGATAPVRRVVSSTPSFFPGTRASTTFTPTASTLQQSPSIPTLRQQAKEQAIAMQQKGIVPRRSMPVLGLPPPAPPPNMPLPPPPPMGAVRGIVV